MQRKRKHDPCLRNKNKTKHSIHNVSECSQMLDVAKGAEVTMISYFKEQQEIMFKELKKSMSKN